MVPRLSIITAIHNALTLNQFYWEMLCQNTPTLFELIVIDNHSTDGSDSFFQKLSEIDSRVVYLRNEFNQSYPVSQIQGLKKARAPLWCFLNNDIWLPKGWSAPFERFLEQNPLQLLSPCGQEAQPRQAFSDALKQKWKRTEKTSKLWNLISRGGESAHLNRSLRWMYGTLDPFAVPLGVQTHPPFIGLNGNAVLFHQSLYEKLPSLWDPRIEAADWHLYLTVAAAHEKDPTIPLPLVLCSVYAHHFGRYTTRRKPELMVKPRDSMRLEQFWGQPTIERLWWGNYLPQ